MFRLFRGAEGCVPCKHLLCVFGALAPFSGEHGQWPDVYRRRKAAQGVYWAEQQRINAAMHERLLRERLVTSRVTRWRYSCVNEPAGDDQAAAAPTTGEPAASAPGSFEEMDWLGERPSYH